MREWLDPDDKSSPTDRLLLARHLKAYAWVLEYCRGKTVLEVGCGAGYGTKMLSGVSRHTVALDLDVQALSRAKARSDSPRTALLAADVTRSFPCTSDAFDVAVAFQVIEHVPRNALPHFFEELSRVVRRGGMVVFTTPNRKTRLLPFQKPFNPYHQTEYSPRGLRKLLSNRSTFRDIRLLGLQASPPIRELELRRVHQHPLRVYLFGPMAALARGILPSSWLRAVRARLRGAGVTVRNSEDAYAGVRPDVAVDTEDFFLIEKELDDALDLVALCQV